jgi:Domain of unknown function (DUF5679)/Integrase core domain
MEIFCVKCKNKTETINVSEIITKNNRKQIKGQCKICNANKSQFVKSYDELKKIYYDPKTGYSGQNDLQRKSGKSSKEVAEFMHKQENYTLHKPVINNFERMRVYTHYPDQQWQSDLAFMAKFSDENNGNKYILTVIDCFSKYAWGYPLKNKKPEGIIECFKKIFKDRKPEKLQVDEGREFMGKFNEFCKENDIIKFSTQNRKIKCGMAERFNRTIEGLLGKVMTKNKNNNWTSILKSCLENYNNSFHNSVKMTPIEASKKENIEIVHANLYPENKEININKPKYKIGDKVRVKIEKKVFDKAYEQTFSDEVCTIDKILKTIPITYQVKDSENHIIKGKYYEEELVIYNP